MAKQTTLNHVCHTGSSSEEIQEDIDIIIIIKRTKDVTHKSHEYHVSVTY